MSARALATLALACLMMVQVIPSGGANEALTPTMLGAGVATVEDPEPWYDGLDGTGHVYIPPSGLASIVVSGGKATLEPGHNEGWIASSIITCPPGNRYDLVVLETQLPEGSSVRLSVLDADGDANEVGYANATIEAFKDVECTVLRIRAIDPATYPRLRIQVRLVGTADARPALLAWSLHYVGADEWRDDFVCDAKASIVRGLNITAGEVELDLSIVKPSQKAAGHRAYPTVVFDHYETTGSNKLDAFFANFDGTGYDEVSAISVKGTRGMKFWDLDGDGYLDLILANPYYGGSQTDSEIYWGDSSGNWSSTGSTKLSTSYAYNVDVGDFDGDGEPDLAFGCTLSSGTVDSLVFLNQGGGTFNYQPDSRLAVESSALAAGDLNNDGYDDVVFNTHQNVKAYFGGPSGVDTTSDLQFTTSGYGYDLQVDDLDGDGYDDMIVGSFMGSFRQNVFMGSESGMDTTADYELQVGNNGIAYDVGHGDMNGDGYTDIAYCIQDNSDRKVYIYLGSASGWSSSSRHVIDVYWYAHGLEFCDVDLDGYEDLLLSHEQQFRVYKGGETLPTTFAIEMDGLWSSQNMAVAVGGKGGTAVLRGMLVTEEIALPEGKRWDTLALEASRPDDTYITLSVLDQAGRPVPGYEDLSTMDVDLAGIGERVIKVEVWLESDVNTTTPSIDRLRVKWQDPQLWRDQFYGPAKAARLLGGAVAGGRLTGLPGVAATPDILFASLRGDEGFSTQSTVFHDSPSMGYGTVPPLTLATAGASSVDMADVDGDGEPDLVFAVSRTGDNTYTAKSPLFLGTPVGWRSAPDHEFPTVGASDVLLEDLDGDGHVDVVFAQETDGETYTVNSTLLWGGDDGFPATPDVEFATNGASGVAAADLDGDGDLDLAFSCYRDASSTSTGSMVFLQGEGGFDGSAPDHVLPTRGARAVAAGDLNGDGRVDLVFANSFHAGSAEISSYVYQGKAGGGFSGTPVGLPTKGATDVALADLDGDGDLDVAFANGMDNSQGVRVSSYVYLNGGSANFGPSPDAELPTVGASAVAVADLDGEGRADLVFACQHNGSGYSVPSRVFLGGASGWSATPDLELPTTGASDVLVDQLLRPDRAAYLSQAITPPDPSDVGALDTLLYAAGVSGSRTATMRVVDALTWETLASTPVLDGGGAWDLSDAFSFRDHTSVRLLVAMEGLDGAGDVWLDNLQLNWTKRVRLPPTVEALSLGESSLLRTQSTVLEVAVGDEYTHLEHLTVRVEHSLVGEASWGTGMLGDMTFSEGAFQVTVRPKVGTPLGTYAFRVNVTDSDGLWSGWCTGGTTLQVRNNLPTSPEVQLTPARPVTTSTLQVEIVQQAKDLESSLLQYRYRWYRDGVPVEDVTGDTLPSSHTSRGDNWTVEVRAFDGDDEGPIATAWRVIENAAPMPKDPLPDPEFDEDQTDSNWLNLLKAFEDPDGDALQWSVAENPLHLTVTIDPSTGVVTLVPEPDWNGEEELTFVASDGELQATQTIEVRVLPVNDAPKIVGINGHSIASDPAVFKVKQGELLVLQVNVVDVEGHQLVFTVNTSAVQLDEDTGEIRFEPGNDDIGTLRFGLKVYDLESPSVKVTLNIAIEVENENDPMDDPRISNPVDGSSYKANSTFYLTATCYDPDVPLGQELNFTWSSSLEGLMGHGSTLTTRLAVVGTHVITLTVTDGEYQKVARIEVQITPANEVDPDPDPDPEPNGGGADGPVVTSTMLVALAVLIAAGVGGYMVAARRRSARLDEEEEEHFKLTQIDHMRMAVKEAADVLEESKNGNGDWVEAEVEEDIEVSTTNDPGLSLSMRASVTTEASKDVAALWKDIDSNGHTEEASEADKEELRLENLKRKYQNAIGRLPYGIPSPELRDREWVELAAALATGERKEVEGGVEVTLIDGRWYYSDPEDSSTFLKEHGAKPKANGRGSNGHGKDSAALLAKLEERFILGEISEDSYRELKERLGG